MHYSPVSTVLFEVLKFKKIIDKKMTDCYFAVNSTCISTGILTVVTLEVGLLLL